MELPIRCFVKAFKRCFLSYIFLAVVFGFLMGTVLIQMTDGVFKIGILNYKLNVTKPRTTTLETPVHINPLRVKGLLKTTNKTDLRRKWLNERIEKLNKAAQNVQMRWEVIPKPVEPNDKFHIFYYAWYENIEYDGSWQHWNHEYLKNWRKLDTKVYPTGKHEPPNDIGSNFYPSLGCYSSRDPVTINVHMKQIREAGIGKKIGD